VKRREFAGHKIVRLHQYSDCQPGTSGVQPHYLSRLAPAAFGRATEVKMHDFAGYEVRRVVSRQLRAVGLSVLALAVLPIAAPAQAADLTGHPAPRRAAIKYATKYTYPPQPRYAESYFPAYHVYEPQSGYPEYAPVDSRPGHRTVQREYRVVVVRDPPIPTKIFPKVGHGPMAYGEVVDPVQAVVETRRYATPELRDRIDPGETIVRSRW
jgi:hypothetical protein